MKTAITSSLITLLFVFSFLQFQQIKQLKSMNQELAGSISNRMEAIQMQFNQALKAQNASMVREVDGKINQSDERTDDLVAGLKSYYPAKLAFDNLKFEHDSLQTQVDQLKRLQVEDNHNLSQSIYRLSETAKAVK